MKTLIAAVLLLTSVSAFSATKAEMQKAIENSSEFAAIQKNYKDMKGSYACGNYEIASTTKVKTLLPHYKMVVMAVLADCEANPNDGGDAIHHKLMSFVTQTTEAGSPDVHTGVRSVVTMAIPQPD